MTAAESARKKGILGQCELFARLDGKALAGLAERAQFRSYLAGDVVFRAGEPGESMMVVAQGSVRISAMAPIARDVILAGEDEVLKSHCAFVAILFADMRGFTAFCESAEPEETIEVLHTYHEAMGELLREHGAGVDQRTGDGIMAIFNDPLPCEDPAFSAVNLALAMRTRMETLCAKWKRLGHRLGFGVGISLGYATVGVVGSDSRYEYTASGTTVNVAARLCDEAEDGEIPLSPRTFAAVEDAFEISSKGEFTLKGIHDPIEVFSVEARAAS